MISAHQRALRADKFSVVVVPNELAAATSIWDACEAVPAFVVVPLKASAGDMVTGLTGLPVPSSLSVAAEIAGSEASRPRKPATSIRSPSLSGVVSAVWTQSPVESSTIQTVCPGHERVTRPRT